MNHLTSAARAIAMALLLFAATGALGRDDYNVLRWTVSVVALFSAGYAMGGKRIRWFLPFALMALAYNPLFRLHPSRSAWIALDLVSAVTLTFSLVWCR